MSKEKISTPKKVAIAAAGGQRSGETSTDASLRGWKRAAGALALAGTVLGGGAAVVKTSIERSTSSDIPGHKTVYDPDKYHPERIGSETPWSFVEDVDPRHDPRNGLGRLEDQLGHAPQPGDKVWVPNDEQQ